jgi:hypothetical protein
MMNYYIYLALARGRSNALLRELAPVPCWGVHAAPGRVRRRWPFAGGT